MRSYLKLQVPSPTAGEDRARARPSSTDGHVDGCVCMEVGDQGLFPGSTNTTGRPDPRDLMQMVPRFCLPGI